MLAPSRSWREQPFSVPCLFQRQPKRHMRLCRRNNRPRDPLPLVCILEIPCQLIRPPAGEFCHNPFAIALTQLVGEPLSMGITPELNLTICLHDAAHRPEGAQQPVIFANDCMRQGMLNQFGRRFVETFQINDDLPALIQIAKIDASSPGQRKQVTAHPIAFFPSIGGPRFQTLHHAVAAQPQGPSRKAWSAEASAKAARHGRRPTPWRYRRHSRRARPAFLCAPRKASSGSCPPPTPSSR